MLKTLGLVLKKQDLGETDRIVTVLTPALGKKRVVARAVRKPLSKLAGHLDSLMVSQLMLTDKPDLPQVTGAVLVESFENIRNDLALLQQSYAVGKVIERLAQEDTPQQLVFQLTVDAFARIDSGKNWSAIWLVFLSALSKYYGVYVSDFRCADCRQPIAGEACFDLAERSLFHPEHTPVAGTRRLDANSLKLLKLLHKEPFDMIAKIRIPLQVAAEIEEILLIELIENYGNAPWRQYASLTKSGK